MGVKPAGSAMPFGGARPAVSAMPFGGVKPAPASGEETSQSPVFAGAAVIARSRSDRSNLVALAEKVIPLLLIAFLLSSCGSSSSSDNPVTSGCHYSVSWQVSALGRNAFSSDHFMGGGESSTCTNDQRNARVEDVVSSLRHVKKDATHGMSHQLVTLDLKAPDSKSAVLSLTRWYPIKETPGAYSSLGPAQEATLPLTCDSDAREKCRFSGKHVKYTTFEGKTYSINFEGVVEKLPPNPHNPGTEYQLSLNDLTVD